MNTISKIANGEADTPPSLLAAVALGRKKPLIIAPAMHYEMYRNPIFQENKEKLSKLGASFVEPRVEEGKVKIAKRVIDLLSKYL